MIQYSVHGYKAHETGAILFFGRSITAAVPTLSTRCRRIHVKTHEQRHPDHGPQGASDQPRRDKYGTFAEIGAGQEVARWFFRVGGAAGTVAKTISAYDMAVSDAIYGPADRYVSRQRLQAMLDYEFDLLLERLDTARGDTCGFFAFANTVATRSFTRKEEGHGWLGIRFQADPRQQPSEIIIHVRMLDKENARQQEALGVIGVNLMHGAFYLHQQPDRLIGSLLDNLTWERVEVDMIRFAGPAFAGVDNRLMALQLVEQDLTEAAMFTADGETVQWADVLHKKPVFVQRGSFRPVTNATLDVLETRAGAIRSRTGVARRAAGGADGNDPAPPGHGRRD